jgi:signal transduction histidine kinase
MSRERIIDTCDTTQVGGMGMGPAVTRTIVRAHGEQLWAMPNVGSICQFTQPAGGAGS